MFLQAGYNEKNKFLTAVERLGTKLRDRPHASELHVLPLPLFGPECKAVNDSLEEQAKKDNAVFSFLPLTRIQRPMVLKGSTAYTTEVAGRTAYHIARRISPFLDVKAKKAAKSREPRPPQAAGHPDRHANASDRNRERRPRVPQRRTEDTQRTTRSPHSRAMSQGAHMHRGTQRGLQDTMNTMILMMEELQNQNTRQQWNVGPLSESRGNHQSGPRRPRHHSNRPSGRPRRPPMGTHAGRSHH